MDRQKTKLTDRHVRTIPVGDKRWPLIPSFGFIQPTNEGGTLMFINFSILSEHLDRYLIGLGGTLAASLISLVASFILGAIIAVFRITPVKPLQWLGAIYVEFIRNIPLMLIAFFTLVGLPLVIGTVLIPFVAGLTALTVYTSAFIAEVIRAGIQAIPKGQMEAARS